MDTPCDTGTKLATLKEKYNSVNFNLINDEMWWYYTTEKMQI